MKIIQEAFVEGRETTTPWDKSKAKQNEVRLDAFAHNADNFNNRRFGQRIPLDQICPDTGNVLRSFPTRFDACKWIVTNVLKISDPENKKAVSISGNMHMCMTAGYKAYGFFWKAVTPATQLAKAKAAAKSLGAVPVLMFNNLRTTKESVFASVNEASRITGVSETQIRRMLKDKVPTEFKGMVFRPYNLTTTTMTFSDAKTAGAYFGVNPRYVTAAVARGEKLNNTIVKLDIAAAPQVVILKGRKAIGRFDTITEAAKELGVSRHMVGRALKSNTKILNAFTVQHRAVLKYTSRDKK